MVNYDFKYERTIFMINTLQEIQDRFEKIKDHKPKASKKLNELGDILASAYKISS